MAEAEQIERHAAIERPRRIDLGSHEHYEHYEDQHDSGQYEHEWHDDGLGHYPDAEGVQGHDDGLGHYPDGGEEWMNEDGHYHDPSDLELDPLRTASEHAGEAVP
jgi:hypothetical protein